jgi:lambda family phage minor tail protein L
MPSLPPPATLPPGFPLEPFPVRTEIRKIPVWETSSAALLQEVQKLTPSPVVELYELDLTNVGDDSILYFHNGTNGLTNKLDAVSFKGIRYVALPILAKGFEMAVTGEPPRPTLSIMNIGGFLSSLALMTNDLVGAKFTRRRTFAKYLDGMPDAAPIEYPPDLFVVEQKTQENRQIVAFELGTGFDLDGASYPTRQITSGYCSHPQYRGPGCRFGENMVVTDSGNRLIPGSGSDFKTTCYKGQFDGTKTYAVGNSVGFTDGDTFGVYVVKLLPPVGTLPVNSTYFTRVQRFRGQYFSEVKSTVEGIDYTDYVVGDVTYIVRNSVRIYGIVKPTVEGFVPCAFPLPNSAYWTIDVCSKTLPACIYRFDPQNVNNPLPIGSFPGTLNLPSV